MLGLLLGLIPLVLLGAGIYLVRHRGSQRFKLVGGVALIVLGILGIIPLSVPYGLVAFSAARCGHMPVIGSDFAADYAYSLRTASNMPCLQATYLTASIFRGGYHAKGTA